MIKIRELSNADEKSAVCNTILRALPDWFEIEESIVDYVAGVQSMPFFVAFDEETAIGFVALKIHNIHTAEICVMGVLQQYHRQGIGKLLVDKCETYCSNNNMEFLTVKTLDESRECDNYNKTRQFYLSSGFKPLEVFPLLWDENNPCLFMAKHIDV
ncbi:MAG: GNAT family N-acetyltransferase [Oscillospiraceae bacterium]|nr:GNAT family N-acetyltransferase [Oscillospiraceae bacterium]